MVFNGDWHMGQSAYGNSPSHVVGLFPVSGAFHAGYHRERASKNSTNVPEDSMENCVCIHWRQSWVLSAEVGPIACRHGKD